ncbi:MAG: ABC transporter substrate-binding protein [Chloroflexota bacterium]|nr:ABC transporter substrate-binding protein [Chloroflexota bacterium]
MTALASSHRRIGPIVCALALLLAACSPAATPAASKSVSATAAAPAAATGAPAASTPPVTVNIGLLANALYAPLFVGVDKGIFLKHGIDLKIHIVTEGTDEVRGLQGGQFQVIGNAWETMLPAASQGVPFKVICVITGTPDVGNYDNQVALVVGPGFKGTSVADLKGKKIAAAMGTAPVTWLLLQLKAAGLAATDVTIQNVSVPNQLSTLANGGADAAVPAEPYGTLMVSKIPGARVLKRGGGVTDVRVELISLGPWVAANPATVEKMVAGEYEAEQYVREHPNATVTATSHYISKIDPAILAKALKYISFDPQWSDKIEKSYDTATQTMVKTGQIKKAPKTTDLLDMTALTLYTKYPQYFTDVVK